MDSYNLAFAVVILASGILADRFGRRAAFLGGITTFALGSLVCALAPTVEVLVAGRALAGVGAALEMPSTLAMLTLVIKEPEERGRALGLWASMNGLAFIVGPMLGGMLADALGWRSVFFVVIPPCIAILLAPALIPPSRGGGGFGLHLFADRSFVTVLLAIAAMTFGIYGMLFNVPYALQRAGLGATAAGAALVPMSVVFVAVSNVTGLLTVRLGSRTIATAGMLAIGAGIGTMALAGIALPVAVPAMMVVGAGLGLVTAPLLGFAAGRAPEEDRGVASAFANAARMLGAALGVALLGASIERANALGLALVAAATVECLGGLAAWRAMRARE